MITGNTSLTAVQLRNGERRKVLSFSNEFFAGRFIAMGILPGSELIMVRKAPFSGGIYIKVDGHNIALRNEEASTIIVQ